MGGLSGAVQWWDESVLVLARSMGELSGAVEWWEWWDESQLRVLVLASLGIQYLLVVFGSRRKYSIPSWFRFVIWLLYLASDALAIYALAALFNRQKKPSSLNGSRDLEVLWAPIMLMHLGGPLFITAYNTEDNELWMRHIVTALSQVAVALYVFWKSWLFSADNWLLAAEIVIFIPGILKCFAKPWALKYASFNSLANSFDIAERTTAANREQELQNYVEKARSCILEKPNSDAILNQTSPSQTQPPDHWANADSTKLYVPEMLFVDFTYPYSRRLTILQSFCALAEGEAYSSLRDGLSDIFDLLYTKKKLTASALEKGRERQLADNSADTPPDCTECGEACGGPMAWTASFLLPPIAILFFSISNKKAYRSDDVTVTFVLLYSAIVLELFSIGITAMSKSQWPDTVAQRSILGQFVQNKRHDKLVSWATCFGCKDVLDQYWPMESCHSSQKLAMLVRTHVEDGWKHYIHDAKSYREFNDIRGQWTLHRERCHTELNWSLEKLFDESILLWHIATELCFHCMEPSPGHDQTCIEMSNYMMHLLVANPEMLMPGSRRSLFAIASNQLDTIMKGVQYPLMERGRISKQVFQKVMSPQDTRTEETFIDDACRLAKGLMDLGDNTMVWRVIQGVWLEMMCFSAGRCRGYLHAKALGSGGEYISYVWLVLAHSGMETFPERLQRTKTLHFSVDLQTGGRDVAGPSGSRGTEEDIMTAPSTSQGDSAVEIVVVST